MPLDETTIKTRTGLILEGCVAEALRLTTYSQFDATPKYDKKSMTPDFLIPNATSPKYFIEVTQTEADNSFHMKVLRYLESVTDAKVHFGSQIVSCNVLMGDPATELPESNVKTLYSFFDANLNPRGDAHSAQRKARLVDLEIFALRLAGDDSIKDVKTATAKVVKKHSIAVADLARQLQSLLDGAAPKAHLNELWNHERARLEVLGEVDGRIPDAPPYKKAILNSLFFSDDDFETLLTTRNPYRLPEAIKSQLIACGIADDTNTAGRLVIDRNFLRFIGNADDAKQLRRICSDVIETDKAMHFFCQDIRDQNRRLRMAKIAWEFLSAGGSQLEESVLANIRSDQFAGVAHRRCWMADLASRFLGVSNNTINKHLVQAQCDPLRLGNPFRQITYKSSRFMSNPESHREYARGIRKAFDTLRAKGGLDLAKNADELANRLLALRLDGVVKLQKLNPLHLVVRTEAHKLNASIRYGSVDNVISDFASDNAATGRFKVFTVSRRDKEVLVNALYADAHGDIHKAKEWASRGRSFHYRYDESTGITRSDVLLVFVADGPWKSEAVLKLRTAGWKVIRLEELGETLSAELGEAND